MNKLLPLYKAILEQVKRKNIDLNTGTSLIKLLEQVSLQEEERPAIAIIGLSGSFPYAADVEQWWERIISNKVNAVRELPQHRAEDIARLLPEQGDDVSHAFGKGAYLEHVDRFDPGFFQISLREARLMDPHQKLFLQTLWHCVEDAGYGGGQWQGSRTGIYVGYSSDFGLEYKRAIEEAAPGLEELSLTGNIKSMLAGRAAHLFDFAGPALLIDTACSSSLVAVHTACKSIQRGECEQALAGGIKLCLAPFETDYASGFSIVSRDYTAKTFDAAADGTGLGEGAAAIALKRLDLAERDGDHIYAIIKGSAVTQDGSSIGLTAPNPAAQEDVLARAWQDAGIDPETIGYIEAHGTGTALGDPIEIEGITAAFRRFTAKRQFCAVGSLKTNIGHLDAAAGIAGLVKTVMALQRRKLPPTLHMRRPNPAIRFEDSPVYVNDRLQDWQPQPGAPRRAGVSSFGLSGTNCHLVVEEYILPAETPSAAGTAAASAMAETEELRLFTLSAYNAPALRTLAEVYVQWLGQREDLSLDKLCYSVHTGRQHRAVRMTIEARGVQELRQKLIRWLAAASSDQEEVKPPSSASSAEAERRLQEWQEAGSIERRDELTRRLAELYRQGAEIDWQRMYDNNRPGRIRLPLSPYLQEHTWLSRPDGQPGARPRPAAASDSRQQIAYYTSSWLSTGQSAEDESGARDALIIVLGDEPSQLAADLSDALRRQHKQCLIHQAWMTPGHDTARDEDGESAATLLQVPFAYRDVILIDERSDEGGGHGSSERLVQLYRWVQWILSDLSARPDQIRVCFATRYERAGAKPPLALHPYHAAIGGLAKVFGQENPRFRTCCMDTDGATRAGHILAELAGQSRACPVMLRDGARYVEQLDTCEPGAEQDGWAMIREQGVYVVTGGLGGIGLAMAAALARNRPVRLVLAGRRGLPPRDQWDTLLADGAERRLCRIIGTIREIEQSGSEVEVHAVNVADRAALARMLTHIREHWGPVRGILHCAGVAGEQRIVTKSAQKYEEAVAPKIDGTLLLDELTSADKPDFIVLFSSITALLAGEGQADYAAANSFLNAYAAWDGRKGTARRVAAVLWPAWKEAGMAADYGIEDTDFLKAITNDEAVQAFWRVLAMREPAVAVGAWNDKPMPANEEGLFRLSERLLERLSNSPSAKREKREPADESPADAAAPDWRAPGTVLRHVQAVLGELLDQVEPDIHASLHDLGVDSIMGGILVQRINRAFPDTASPVDLYTFPTAAAMAEQILAVLRSREADEPAHDQETTEEERMLSMLRALKAGSVSVDATMDRFQKGMGK